VAMDERHGAADTGAAAVSGVPLSVWVGDDLEAVPLLRRTSRVAR